MNHCSISRVLPFEGHEQLLQLLETQVRLGRLVIGAQALTAILLQLLAAAVAGYGSYQCTKLQRFGPDGRLRALSWFFGLFALAILVHAIWEYQVDQLVQQAQAQPRGRGAQFLRPQGRENVNFLLMLHYIAMVASLAVGVVAFGRKPRTNPAPVAALAALGSLVPLLLSAQVALTLYLAVRAVLNHLERRSRGALQVAAGFTLFFLGHLRVLLVHQPGVGREPLSDILTLVGIVLLVQVLPRPARG